jgi:DNA repair protein RadC
MSKLDIKSWAAEDRPREKLLQKGRTALTNAELIAILIGSGTRSLSAVDVSKSILSSVHDDLNKLASLQVSDLVKFEGIGEAKAISIVSAIELGRRRKEHASTKKLKITCSQDAYEFLKPSFLDQSIECFWVMFLNRANNIIRVDQISLGGVSGTVVDPKVIFNKALEYLASGIIISHNHPSGNLRPSQADKQLTQKLVKAGIILEIPVIDHIICTNNGYYSFKDEGDM